MSYDIQRIRAEFPGLARMEGNKPAVFFDNPAGTQICTRAIDAMVETMIHFNANLGGAFTTSRLAQDRVDEAHAAAADFVNAADRDEVFFGQNMTTITFALSRSIARELSPGDEIVLSRMDHDANISPWLEIAAERGAVVKWIDLDPSTFELDLSGLDTLITPRTRVVAVGYASNLTGTINDVKTITRAARKVGALVFIDAVQFAPHGVIDVQDIGCDALVCSAYKFFGPHYGLAWVRRELQERLHAYKVRPAPEELPDRFVTGTANREELAGVMGAIDYYAWVGETFGQPEAPTRRARIVAGVRAMSDYDLALVQRLIAGLQAVPGLTILGITDPAAFERRVPTVSFRLAGHTTAEVAQYLADQGIYVWDGHNYAIEPCQRLGILEDGGVVRVGLTHYNTMAEVERLLDCVMAIGETL